MDVFTASPEERYCMASDTLTKHQYVSKSSRPGTFKRKGVEEKGPDTLLIVSGPVFQQANGLI